MKKFIQNVSDHLTRSISCLQPPIPQLLMTFYLIPTSRLWLLRFLNQLFRRGRTATGTDIFLSRGHVGAVATRAVDRSRRNRHFHFLYDFPGHITSMRPSGTTQYNDVSQVWEPGPTRG